MSEPYLAPGEPPWARKVMVPGDAPPADATYPVPEPDPLKDGQPVEDRTIAVPGG